jgi:hypothetical protein
VVEVGDVSARLEFHGIAEVGEPARRNPKVQTRSS